MNQKTGGHTSYMAYMLRLWEAGSHGSYSIWRASLESPHTGERLAFASVEALFAFLAEKTGSLTKVKDVPDIPGRTATEEERTIP